jgi:hypothetical protein
LTVEIFDNHKWFNLQLNQWISSYSQILRL